MPNKTVLCRYCFNLNHWVPAREITAQVDCIYCGVCPMYVPVHSWDQHEHQQSGDSDTLPKHVCLECPTCSGPIPPNASQAECLYCDGCHSFIPVGQWDKHNHEGDPFTK